MWGGGGGGGGRALGGVSEVRGGVLFSHCLSICQSVTYWS